MKSVVSVSVLFTDLVGSTELASRLGPVEAEELRTVHFALLREAIEVHDGAVVKNLGDGLMVTFGSIAGALDGAVAIQQTIDRHNRTGGVSLGVRIGVSSGDAVFDEVEGDYFGEAIVEAARLCAAAEGGQILTTAMVRMLARRTAHGFTPLGEAELKGLPDPVELQALLWEPTAEASPVRLPSRLTTAPETGLLGRAEELERLSVASKEACSGSGHRVVLVSGEPGIGKTTLVTRQAQLAHEDGAVALHGRCDDELRVPYQPFAEAIGGWIAAAPDVLVQQVDPSQLGQLARMVPEVRRRAPDLPHPTPTDADAERYLLLGAVTELLKAIAAQSPVVLVLEDLHWADRSTVVLLRHLVATLGQARVLVLGTYRDSDLTVDHPLSDGLAALRREPNVERVALGGLDDDDVVALVRTMAGEELPHAGVALAHAVRRETGGNPFFAGEMFRHLVESGAVGRVDGRWVTTAELSSVGLPESVREVVGRRIRRLSADAQEVLAIAAVVGRDFDLPLVALAAERSEDDVLDGLEEAVAASVVEEVDGRDERFSFVHSLLQHTLYEDLSAGRRSRVHRRIAELLEVSLGPEPGDRIGELAQHWVAATRPADAGKAAMFACRAGERALGALAPHEAVRWYRQALELLDGEPLSVLDRLDALVGLGVAQRHIGDPAFRDTLLEVADAAHELGDDDRLVRATLANQRGMVSSIGTVDRARIEMLERALDVVDPGDSAIRARLLSMLVAEISFGQDLARIRALAAQAEAMARRLGDEATLLSVLNVMFLPLWVPDVYDETVARSEEASVLAERVGDPVAAFQATTNRIQMMASRADRRGMEDAIELAARLADEIGQPHMIWQVLSLRCIFVLLSGDVDAADQIASHALQVSSDSGQPDALVIYGANLINIRLHQDRLGEILPFVEQAAEANPGLPSFRSAHALALCELGRLEEARPLLAAAAASDFHRSSFDYVWLTTATVWADVAARLEEPVAARTLHARLRPYVAQGICSGASFSGTVAAFVARLSALLGMVEEADQLFALADRQLRDLRAPFWLALNHVEWARHLAAGGDLEGCRRLLAEASEVARSNGCPGVARRISAVEAVHGR